MSPEQAAGDHDRLGPPSDVYSMGGILYHLLSGKAPHDRTAQGVRFRQLVDPMPPPLSELAPDAPPELVAIAEKAMQRAPEDRYPDMIGMAEDLRAYLEGRVVLAHRTGLVIELRKWMQRNRALAAALLAVVVLTASGLAAISLITTSKNRELRQRNDDLAAETERANRQRDLASERATEVLRLSDLRNLETLGEEAETLWPPRRETIPSLQEWIDSAEDLADQIPVHRASIATLQEAIKEAEASSGAPLDDPSHVPEAQLRWWLETESRLVERLEAFLLGKGSTLENVRYRLTVASTIEMMTIEDQRDAWSAAAERVRGHALYGGLELEPIIGLVPLGPDPVTTLEELWFPESGKPPVRDEETGRWIIAEDTGLVFVLLPGGTFTQGIDPSQPHYSPAILQNATPPSAVTLAPFLLSKYEVTQGQWIRLTGENPSEYAGESDSMRRPVERMTWLAALLWLSRRALELPTEAQWEYACRAGTPGFWYTGDEPSEMAKIGNCGDRSYNEKYQGSFPAEPWFDGWITSAPVGSYEPNPFGLHDVHGNVFEWCRDLFLPYTLPARSGDGFRDTEDPTKYLAGDYRVARGGCFYVPASFCGSAVRAQYPSVHTDQTLGVRPIVVGWPKK
ncbi:MAG: SUMF1/EgtB/PvdO family nonheme iron enzyme [Planctomycetota bacterium]